ncbi:MAG: 4-hydroxy-3-methylbut-2-enyl diphosphate reductase [Bacilli bacterium]
MKVTVAKPYGYCEGVVKAIDLALAVRKDNPDMPISVLGMLVHNERVVKHLEDNQITTINIPISEYEAFLKQAKPPLIIIFTAHGHDPKLDRIAQERGLITYDATCKKVLHAFSLIEKALAKGQEVIYLGKKGHPEPIAALARGEKVFLYDVEGYFDYRQLKTKNPFVITQTTLSLDEVKGFHLDIKARLPEAEIGNEICQATRLRQKAVKLLPMEVEHIYIIGSPRSSNTTRLALIAKTSHPRAKIRLVRGIHEINRDELKGLTHVGVASGASTPREVVHKVIDFLENFNQ